MTSARTVAIVLCLVLAPTQSALAHRLQVFAAAEGRTIAGDAYFAGGAPAAGIRVLIEDAAGADDQLGEISREKQQQRIEGQRVFPAPSEVRLGHGASL